MKETELQPCQGARFPNQRVEASHRLDTPLFGFAPGCLIGMSFIRIILCLAGVSLSCALASAAVPQQAVAAYRHGVEPILEDYCYNCHGEGKAKGKVAFDVLTDADLTARPDLWFKVLKNLRSNIMPPAGEDRPSPEEAQKIKAWIKYSAFGIQPDDPDPGRVTLRRLNRVEYGRTVKTLLGVDFPSEVELPPDDTGQGFDNIGDVLSVSPLLIEKYLRAADSIVSGVVPESARIVPVKVATGRDFRSYGADGGNAVIEDGDDATPAYRERIGRPLAYHEAVSVAHEFAAPRDAMYRLSLDLEVKGPFNFDPERCLLQVKVDGAMLMEEKLGWQYRKPMELAAAESWKAGEHEVSIAVTPLAPAKLPPDAPPPEFDDPQKLEVRILSVQVQGPFGESSSVEPPGYRRFFPRDVPRAEADRERYAREILSAFASRAFRRPVDDAMLARLVRLAHGVETQQGGTFEQGVARAMMAVLASPRFLFRFEEPDPADAGTRYPRVDEFSLASRLSYFLWSTMPDETLFDLAQRGELRANLRAQVERMLRDPQAEAFVHNFTGQWLQARDVEFVPINKRAILGLGPPVGLPRIEFDMEMRRAMRSETEMVFGYITRGDRSVLELVDSNYTFLNEKLANEYGVPGVKGKNMRLVELPEGSPRGGVLTEGTVLTVTSNPTRTSPVKRGQFILLNILGTPAPPPPPNIPALEESKAAFGGREPTLKEMLATHRKNTLCSSCHGRMDPLGLALENFNALGEWRTTDAGQPIAPAGKLITGERFQDVRELKHIITHERRSDYYRCITEKMLVYALGRGLEYGDVEAVDRIVDRLENDGGRFSTLLLGVIESTPFQRQRRIAPKSPEMSPRLVLSSNP
jgi:hypothetical protein